MAIISPISGNLAPSIVSLPESETISVGEQVRFDVAVSGTAPFTYQWMHNDVPIPGATSATLTLSNPQEAEAGKYKVQVTGPGGTSLVNQQLYHSLQIQIAMVFQMIGKWLTG